MVKMQFAHLHYFFALLYFKIIQGRQITKPYHKGIFTNRIFPMDDLPLNISRRNRRRGYFGIKPLRKRYFKAHSVHIIKQRFS